MAACRIEKATTGTAAGGRPAGNAGRFGPVTQRDVFVAFFSAEDNEPNPTEYQAGIPQALRLMNSPQFNATLQRHPAIRKGGPAAETVEQLYLSTLSRMPTDEDVKVSLEYLGKNTDKRKAWEDIHWALINSKEFLFRH